MVESLHVTTVKKTLMLREEIMSCESRTLLGAPIIGLGICIPDEVGIVRCQQMKVVSREPQ